MTAILFLLRAIILVLLWAFVIAAIVAVRQDVFGSRKAARRPATPRGTPSPAPARPARAAEPRARRERGTPRRLVVTDGALQGTTVPLGDVAITIGRADDSTLVLTDDYVSTRHARLMPRGDEWVLEDLGSTNGTYLGRQRVTDPVAVALGAQIRVGKTVLELRR
jgi:pSer/pThr/pTyr-binding forkhead associated (FHA) protein